MKKGLTILIFLTVPFISFCQQKQDVLDYIAKYKDIAIEEMLRCKIPASIILAQGIHESSCGKSPLSQQANNHFGIKCKSDWDGKRFYKDDDEPNECFRVYKHAADSYIDHSDFLVTHDRYAKLFNLPVGDYKSWAYGIKAAGYATNPKYPQILITTIETYNLTQYDNIALAMGQHNEKLLNPSWPQENVVAANTIAVVPPAQPAVVSPASVTKPAIKEEAAAKVTSTDNTEKVLAVAVSNSNATPLAFAEPQKNTAPPIAPATQPVSVNKPIDKEPAATIFNSSGSRKEYLVNGARAIKAEGNENPLKVAFDYNLVFERVLSFNDLGASEYFKNGEYIFLQAKKSRGEQPTYMVQQGETMRDISQKFGIRLQDLYSKNEMTYTENEQVLGGETIYLQEKRIVPPKTISYSAFLKMQGKERNNSSTASIPATDNQYRVQESDTLFTIARKFNLSVEQLKAINNLQDNNLHAGQTLVVSK